PVADERGIGGAPQQAIELVELSALSLPAHPALLALAPEAPAVEEIETSFALGRRAVPTVELGDARSGGVEQALVAGRVLGGRIGPIRQEDGTKRAVGGGEASDAQ